MKLAGDASYFPNPQNQLWYNFGLLVGQAFAQVEAYIIDEGINLTEVPAIITVLKMAIRDSDGVRTVERQQEVLKQINCKSPPILQNANVRLPMFNGMTLQNIEPS
jgi:G:T/U-mismatch repair DNA glycosylase